MNRPCRYDTDPADFDRPVKRSVTMKGCKMILGDGHEFPIIELTIHSDDPIHGFEFQGLFVPKPGK